MEKLGAVRELLIEMGKEPTEIKKLGDVSYFYVEIKGIRYRYVEDSDGVVSRYED